MQWNSTPMTFMRSIRKRLDYPHVVSTLALFIALTTGVAFALSVNSGDIVNNTIRSEDVRNNDLTTKDIKDGTLAYPTKFKSGQLYRGVVGARDNVGASTGSITALATIPAEHRQTLADSHVVVDGGADEVGNVCKGTGAGPTAPKGIVCVYPLHTDNATNIRGLGMQDSPFGTLWGFRIAWEPTVANDLSLVEATWAYRAP